MVGYYVECCSGVQQQQQQQQQQQEQEQQRETNEVFIGRRNSSVACATNVLYIRSISKVE